jgi:hypothetical protein
MRAEGIASGRLSPRPAVPSASVRTAAVLKLRTAKAIGFTFPDSILVLADEVIE